MLCTSCWRTARPDIWLEGSDRLELAGWLCGVVPGLLYCAWRQAGRRRACPACGGLELVREARALRDAEPEGVAWGAGRWRCAKPLRWPAALRSPRLRIRHGLWTAVTAGAAVLSATGPPLLLGEVHSAQAALPVATLWLLWLAADTVRGRRAALPARAVDAGGRPIPLEILH